MTPWHYNYNFTKLSRSLFLKRIYLWNITYYRPHPKDDGRLYFQSVHTLGGGTPYQVRGGYPISGLGGGVPHLRSRLGWGVPHPRSCGVPHTQVPGGGTPSQVGGYPISGLGGYPISGLGGGAGTPPKVKGKIFDTRFGLIHVQTGKKNFAEGPPPPPQ